MLQQIKPLHPHRLGLETHTCVTDNLCRIIVVRFVSVLSSPCQSKRCIRCRLGCWHCRGNVSALKCTNKLKGRETTSGASADHSVCSLWDIGTAFGPDWCFSGPTTIGYLPFAPKMDYLREPPQPTPVPTLPDSSRSNIHSWSS
jgi:hypothetical protein